MESRLYLEPRRIIGDWVEVAACLELPRGRERLWWRVPAPWADALTPWADPFVVGLLFPAMQAGCDLCVEGAVSPSLLQSLEAYMAVWHTWFPQKYRPMHIRAAEEIEAPAPSSNETIIPFSCGVDSAFTARRHTSGLVGRRSRRIGAGMVMRGFDVRIDQEHGDSVYGGILSSAQAMLQSVGVACIPVTTNFRQLRTFWGHSHATHLVSGLHLLSGRFNAGLIPNSVMYHHVGTLWGSNPLADPLLGSGRFGVFDDGGESSRAEKIELLTQWPEALAHLRVCFGVGQQTHANCCVCEKCIRTRLGFHIFGVPNPLAFPRPITVRQISSVRFHEPINVDYWNELYDVAVRRGVADTPWARAIQTAIRRHHRRQFRTRLKRIFVPLRNRIRVLFRGSPLSRKELERQAAENEPFPSSRS